MKKFIAIVFVLGLWSLAGCGSKTPAPTANSAPIAAVAAPAPVAYAPVSQASSYAIRGGKRVERWVTSD